MRRIVLSGLLGLSLLSAVAQDQAPREFPAGATTLDNEALRLFVEGKTLAGRFSNGQTYRNQFDKRGYLFFNGPGGFADSGRWNIENGQLCGSLRTIGNFCNDVRLLDGALYLKRLNGEIVKYEVQ